MKRLVLLLLPALGACVPSGHLASLRAPRPVFDPAAFFVGHTRGVGQLKIVFSGTKPTLVEGHGRMEGDTLVLDQRVTQGDKPATTRQWRLHDTGGGRWTGTLTDARGPVVAEVEGNRFHVAFAMKGGTHAEQWLYLRPGGTVVTNRMVVTKFGLPVASLDETITHLAG
jgi:hypothetical protein